MALHIDKSCFLAEGCIVTKNVTLEENCSVWFNTTIRGDEGDIYIKSNTNIQDNAVIHGGKNYPVTVGHNVTIGHSAIVHGCSIGDNSLIGMGSIILNGAKIGKNCIIGAGSLVTQNTVIPDNSLAFGSPCKIIRPTTPEEIASNISNAQTYIELSKEYL
ncbi:gamma carbonic anhydrase family protein [Lachnobacterium bovis]|uniref:gamma carbonic anhydrase family protein n=1 Tax=Lachnobacterium bovis TaxID=140626 RepID=UPI0004838470|nr:gamma carbonic anhydrase family protein [Lachnobacterium bovis]